MNDCSVSTHDESPDDGDFVHLDDACLEFQASILAQLFTTEQIFTLVDLLLAHAYENEADKAARDD